jgi:lipopolysaccharide export LptBFGC system permease protein LptF
VSVTLPVTLALTLALATVTPVLVVGAAGRWLFWRDNRADGQIESRTSPGW